MGCRRGTGQRSRAPRDACGISFFVHEAGGIQPRAEAGTTLVAPDSAGHVQLASDGETRAPGGLTAGRSGLFPFDMMPGTGGAPHLHTRVSESFYVLSGSRRCSMVGGGYRAGRARSCTSRNTAYTAFATPRTIASASLWSSPRYPSPGVLQRVADVATSGRQPSEDELIGIHQRHDHYLVDGVAET